MKFAEGCLDLVTVFYLFLRDSSQIFAKPRQLRMLSRSHVAVEGVNHLLGNRVYQHCWEFNDLLHSESLFLRVIVLALTLKIEHNRVVNLSFEQKVINLTRICPNNTVLKSSRY